MVTALDFRNAKQQMESLSEQPVSSRWAVNCLRVALIWTDQ